MCDFFRLEGRVFLDFPFFGTVVLCGICWEFIPQVLSLRGKVPASTA